MLFRSSVRVTDQPAEKAETAVLGEAVRQIRHPVRPLTDIEADAVQLRELLHDWNASYPLQTSDSAIPILNVPNCLRLRAVACRMRRLEEEAGDTEVTEVTELGKDIEDLLDEAGDEEYTVALDYELDPLPTAYQWGELAERYEETARAQEAFEWWIAHRNVLSVTDVQALAEAVAAIQQRFNRLLFRIGARDPFQQQLFDDLRVWAKEAQCYLYSLRPKVPIAELIEKAQSIDEAWEQARIPLHAQDERQKAIETVLQMVAHSDFGDHEDEDATRLKEALANCRELKVSPVDRRLRDALLPWSVFLEEDERFRELVREIHNEWERRKETGKLDTIDTATPTSQLAQEVPDTQVEAVHSITAGKRCFMVGGVAREELRHTMQKALGMTELLWPEVGPLDTLTRFAAEIEQSDIVVLITRFSRKEWSDLKDSCSQGGKRFVRVPACRSAADVIRSLYDQVVILSV